VADLERLDPVELFECFRLLVGVTHGQHVRRHLRYDVPRERDVIVCCVLSTDRKSDDVVVVDERRNHVYLAGHVDCSQQHLRAVVVTLYEVQTTTYYSTQPCIPRGR